MFASRRLQKVSDRGLSTETARFRPVTTGTAKGLVPTVWVGGRSLGGLLLNGVDFDRSPETEPFDASIVSTCFGLYQSPAP